MLSGTIVADARRKSLSMHIAMLAERAHCGHCDVLFETKDKLTLERFKLFNRRLDSGTEKELVRATVKVASSSTQACGRERVLRILLCRPHEKGQKGSRRARYLETTSSLETREARDTGFVELETQERVVNMQITA